jgi:hypothetical protein
MTSPNEYRFRSAFPPAISQLACCTSTLPVLRAGQGQMSTPLTWIREMYASAVRDRRLHRILVDDLGPDDPGGLIRS